MRAPKSESVEFVLYASERFPYQRVALQRIWWRVSSPPTIRCPYAEFFTCILELSAYYGSRRVSSLLVCMLLRLNEKLLTFSFIDKKSRRKKVTSDICWGKRENENVRQFVPVALVGMVQASVPQQTSKTVR